MDRSLERFPDTSYPEINLDHPAELVYSFDLISTQRSKLYHHEMDFGHF